MAAGITGIDHPVIAVADMDRARAVYERLGFTVPPRGSHLEWGTGNWCIMFPLDYLELRGILDPRRYTHHLDRFLATRGEGLMGIAFATASADASHAAATASGLSPEGPKDLTRRFELPDGDVFPRFRIVYLPEDESPGLLTSVICEHRTPEVIRRPAWLAHANGATRVLSMTCVVEEPAAVRHAHEKLFGATALVANAAGHDVRFEPGARLEVRGADAPRLAAGSALPCLPAMEIGVADVATTASTLARNGVPFDRGADGAIHVAAVHACGVAIAFVEVDGRHA